ncbi:MAG: diacylglycerol kinase family lipid kinase [Acidobacteriota bacterium]|nr:diacylglycerol kinase family lipid kinase [Acidobacteriota bacterium]NLH70597.1 diacylglycerol kinase family lipid kinase [Brooklawnia sp.]
MEINSPGAAQEGGATARRLAVVFNPTKAVDEALFTSISKAAARQGGWEPPFFLPTVAADAGRAATQQALRLGADMVIVSGGDGTVRAVGTSLQGSGVPCAIIPSGTGNLLARNLGIPLDHDRALEVAFRERPRRIDLAKLVLDHDEENAITFTGMAGIGFDAAMMRDTDEGLKRVVGSVAYVVAFARHIGMRPRPVRMRLSGQPEVRRRAVLMMVGNTGQLQGGVWLFPGAKPDDGQLDVLITAPTHLGKWAKLLSVLLRRSPDPAVEYWSGSRVVFELDEPIACEVDGDIEGSGTHFEFSVMPGAMLVVAPAPGVAPDGYGAHTWGR